MAKQYKSVLDANTNEIELVELSVNEIAELEASKKEALDRIEQFAANLENKKNLLIKLGITEDEAKLLLG
jgi:hypothetical protein